MQHLDNRLLKSHTIDTEDLSMSTTQLLEDQRIADRRSTPATCPHCGSRVTTGTYPRCQGCGTTAVYATTYTGPERRKSVRRLFDRSGR